MDDNTASEMRAPDGLLGAALRYIERGWWIFPAFVTVRRTGSGELKKRPQFPPSWEAASTNDPAMAHAWFGPMGLYREGVLCIDTGRSGLVVMDIDSHGKVAWDAFRLAHGDVPETWRVITPSGGEHWFYRARPGSALTVDAGKKLAPGVDMRSVGGLVFAAPSDIRGYGPYRWVEGEPEPGDLPVIPMSIVTVMTPLRPPAAGVGSVVPVPGSVTGIGVGTAPRMFTADEAWEFVRGRAEEFGGLDPRRDGLGRNQKLFELALVMAHFVGVFWDESSVHAQLVALAERNGMVNTHGIAAVDATIRSAWGRQRDWVAVARPGAVAAGGDQGGSVPSSQSGTDSAPEGAVALAAALTLPESFWAARGVLRHIREAAHARNRSGDVALHSVLARLAALHPALEVLDTGVGDAASLNYFAAIVGPSGAGKSSGLAVAGHLLNVPKGLDFEDGIPLGSGEGLAEAFMGSVEEKTVNESTGKEKVKTVRRQVRANAFVYADEGEALTKLLERPGTTIGEALRRAWVGARLGQKNGTDQTTRIVTDYALGLVIGFQPDTALPLLADSHAGTPQRFLWVWAADPSIPDAAPAAPGPLAWAPRVKALAAAPESAAGAIAGLGTWSGEPWCAAEPMTLDAGVMAEIREADLGRSRGQVVVGELDAHEPLSRVKVAALLALLDGRGHVTREDWELSAVVWQTSCRVRDYLIGRAKDAAVRKVQASRDEHGRRAAAGEHAVLEVRDRHLSGRVLTAAEKIRDKAQGLPAGGMARGDFRQGFRAWRAEFDLALDYAAEQGWIAHEGHRVFPPK